MSTLNINNTDNQVTAVNANQSIIITDNSNINNIQTSVNVTQPVTSVILVNTPGPQGLQGPSGSGGNIDTSSFATTSSFNSFTSSYQIDSSSFNTRIDNLTLATSSYVLNSQTSSFITNLQTSSMNVSSSLTSSYSISSSYALSSSRAITSSYADFVRAADTKLFAYSRTSITPVGASEELLTSILIPANTLGNNDSIEITAMYAISGSTGSARVVRTRLNSTNTLTAATTYNVWSNASLGLGQIQTYTRIVQSGSNGQEGFQGTNANVVPFTFSVTSLPPSSSLSNTADIYIIFSATKPVGDLVTLRNYDIKINRA